MSHATHRNNKIKMGGRSHCHFECDHYESRVSRDIVQLGTQASFNEQLTEVDFGEKKGQFMAAS